jgi:hypothetical protein
MGYKDNEADDDEAPEYPEMTDPSLGAPDGFWNNIDRGNHVDSRISEAEARSETPPNQSADGDDLPIRRIGTPGVTNDHLIEYRITRDEAGFMRAIVEAMNGELQGYDLTESMSKIKSLYEIDEDKLIESGYLKRHTGSDRRAYYTVTFDGQEACRIGKKQGRRYGDIGSDTPHRVGMELAKRYYESLPNVRFVEVAVRENGQKTDLIVVDNKFNRRAIIEVEGGRVEADPNISEGDRTGLSNYESVRNDYRVLAASAGESIWVVRNYEIASDVLQILASGDDIPFELETDIIQAVKNKNKRIKDLNENHLSPLQDEGITEILTFKQLRNILKQMNSDS